VPFLPKKLEDIWTEFPGVVSFPWELALMLHFGVHQRGVPLSRLVQMNSFNPARRFGLWPRKGEIEVGFDADLVLVDLDEERTVEHNGKGTCIYEGWKLKGWPVMTVARGEVVYENGEVSEQHYGRGRCVTVPS
jgi:dihydroorotase-like cyclic amidohydrolase